VPPLAIPDPEETPDFEAIAQCEAIDLFVQRSQAVDPNFELTEGNALLVAEICRQLDGLPLAIELAAARSKVLPPQAILARLSSRLKLLTTGGQDLTPRQQTLRGAIDWSYDLLGIDDQMLFRRMSAFVGGATLDSVEGVCRLPAESTEALDALEGVSSLLGKSLLRRVDEPHAGSDVEARFSMYWTIREYALEKLVQSGEEQAVRRQHAAFFLRLAEAAEPHLTSGGRGPWMERLESEWNNIRVALEWCGSEQGDHVMGLRLAGALGWYWYFRGHFSEARRWLEDMLAATETLDTSSARAKALFAAGNSAWGWEPGTDLITRSRLEESVAIWRKVEDKKGLAYSQAYLGLSAVVQNDRSGISMIEQSTTLLRQVGDKWGLAYMLHWLAAAQGWADNLAQATRLFSESLSVFKEQGDKWGIAMGLGSLGRVAFLQGDYDKAISWLQQGLAIEREMKDKWLMAQSQRSLGDATHYKGDYTRAASLYADSLALYHELGDRSRTATLRRSLGHALRQLGDYDRAAALYKESLEGFRDQANEAGTTWCIAAWAGLARGVGLPEQAARLTGAVEALVESMNPRIVMPVVDLLEYDRTVDALHATLDTETFTRTWAEGRAMTIEQAVACIEETPVVYC
jgi:predicted ATPase